MRSFSLLTIALLLVAASPQEKKGDESKGMLKAGEELPGTFQPYNLNGRFKGRFHCLVCEHGLNPTAAIFVRGTDDLQGLTALLEGLETAIKDKKNAKARLGAFVVFEDEQLADVVANDDKRDEVSKKIDDLAAKLDRVTIALGTKADFEKYRLKAETDVSIVLYNQLKVVDVLTNAKAKLTKENAGTLAGEIVNKLVGKK